MTDSSSLQNTIQEIFNKTERELAQKRARLQEEQEKFKKELEHFDTFADKLQDEVLMPAMEYLANLFPNTEGPIAREEHKYRHRIHLRFLHTKEYPCTADLTLLIIHCLEPGFAKIKFDYIILPTYVTKQYKLSDEIQIPMDENKPGSSIESMLKKWIEVFLENYLQTKKM